MKRFLWIGLVLAFVMPAHAAKLVLAAKGQPVATIVTPVGAADRLTLAAAELQRYVKAVCGVELPLSTDGKAVTGTGLYIGRCEPTLDADMPGGTLNPETYAIHVRNGSVYFTGRYPTPTYFAVISFIEDGLGVRWFAPGEEWEHVPPGKPGELTVEVKDRVVTPTTSPRIWSGHGWNADWEAWRLRNKAVLSEVVPRRQFQNNLHLVFPPSKYGQTHPEYYPLVNGKRWIPTSDADSAWRPCESNPEVQRLTVEYARKWFDEHSDVDSFSVGMDDIANLCGCDNCRAWDPRPDSYEKLEFSDRHYRFVNIIAKEIAKTHPDRYVGTLIYSIARKLPETVDKLEPNVFGYITETSAHWYYKDIKQADQALTREWARRCRHLSRYDYYGMGGMTPRVYPHLMAEQIRFDKSLGMEGMYIEMYTFLPNTAPMIWAFARLQVDHTLNVDTLLGEFYAKMFGAAGGTMRQYFDLLERSWCTPREGRKGQWVHRNLKVQALAMAPEDVDEGFRLLRQARREAQSEREKERIASLRAALQYGSYPIKAYALSQRLLQLTIDDAASAGRAIEMAAEVGRLAAERERFWAEAPEREDLLGETVRGLSGMGYLMTGQMPALEAGSVQGAMRAVDWYARHAPGEVAKAVALLEPSMGTSLGQTLGACLWAAEHNPPNLLGNGGFELTGANEDRPQADWRTSGAPPNWNVWASGERGRFSLEPGQGRDGSVAATISGAGSACYLQTVPVEPGEKYLATVWVRSQAGGSVGGAYLGLRFQTPAGAWHPREDLEPFVAATDGLPGWQPVLVSVTIPEGAGLLVVMLGAGGQDDQMKATFDDAVVQKVSE